jgi:ribonuclease HI
MRVAVYTDGACSKNGRAGACASWAFYFPEHKSLSNAERVVGIQTNQRGELTAISEAVKAAEKSFDVLNTELKIYTDSMYSKNCLTTWLLAWTRNNWKTSQGKDVNHRDLIEDTAKRLSRFKSFNITHVKAHTGEEDEHSVNNSIVDKMATEVLNGPEKIVTTNTQEAIPNLPLKLMGPPIYETEIIKWCLENLDELDKTSLNSALMSALTKTLNKKGFALEKQRLHRSNLYRLKTNTGLIKETTIIKE